MLGGKKKSCTKTTIVFCSKKKPYDLTLSILNPPPPANFAMCRIWEITKGHGLSLGSYIGFPWKKTLRFSRKQHWNRLGVPMDPFPFQRYNPLWGSAGFPTKKQCNFLSFPIPDSDWSLLKITIKPSKQRHIQSNNQPKHHWNAPRNNQGSLRFWMPSCFSRWNKHGSEQHVEDELLLIKVIFGTMQMLEEMSCTPNMPIKRWWNSPPQNMWLTLTSIFNLWWIFRQNIITTLKISSLFYTRNVFFVESHHWLQNRRGFRACFASPPGRCIPSGYMGGEGGMIPKSYGVKMGETGIPNLVKDGKIKFQLKDDLSSNSRMVCWTKFFLEKSCGWSKMAQKSIPTGFFWFA